MDNLPAELRLRATQLFDCVINYAIDLLMWQNCVELPDFVKPSHVCEFHVTMLFNDEVHTYEQVAYIRSFCYFYLLMSVFDLWQELTGIEHLLLLRPIFTFSRLYFGLIFLENLIYFRN